MRCGDSLGKVVTFLLSGKGKCSCTRTVPKFLATEDGVGMVYVLVILKKRQFLKRKGSIYLVSFECERRVFLLSSRVK